jgi:hypothetical protein
MVEEEVDGSSASLADTLSIRYGCAEESEYTAAYQQEVAAARRPPPPPKSMASERTTASTSRTGGTAALVVQVYEHASALVPLLGVERADSEPEWMRVGWCLHNIEPSDRMRQLWDEFSRKSGKYEASGGECRRRWDSMQTRPDGLNMGHLHMWAREDDPEGYSSAVGSMRFTSSSQVTWDTLQHSTTVHPYKVAWRSWQRSC